MSQVENSQLGKQTVYCAEYDASLLFPILRQEKRDELAISPSRLPFQGVDVWTAFEVSWLNEFGLPQVRVGHFTFDASSPYLVESKSFKLYLNSFNGTRFSNETEVMMTLKNDLTEVSGKPVQVYFQQLEDMTLLGNPEGECLDAQTIEIESYQLDASLLSVKAEKGEEQVFSHLLKSNCLVTGQPDWGSLIIRYSGHKIDHASLLSYIVSYRDHMEFHEQCVERVFTDLMERCQPEKLLVYARYVRRGGLDINPYRANYDATFDTRRLIRQ